MSQIPWYDYVRIVTAIASLLCMYMSARRFRRQSHLFTPQMRDLWWVMNGFLFATFEGSLEQILGLRSFGPRVILVLIVVLVCVRANFRKEQGYIKRGPRHH